MQIAGLAAGRRARLATYLAEAAAPAPPPLLSVTQVDSKHDPRVQVADLLAGLARRRSPELVELLEPYLQTCADRKSSQV